MNPLSPFFCIVILLIAFITGYLIKLNYRINPVVGRYESIEGMRGFLALGVFIHHSSIWHQYLQTGYWAAPNSNLYNQFGQTSVSLFFMITSFLFISKLLNANENGFKWQSFFLSRVFRLVPMYFFSIWLIIISIMFISNWQVNVELSEFLKSVFNWCFFTIYQTPNINNSGFTSFINAGVVWSLPYEWLFYFSLPIISIFLVKVKPKLIYLILSLVFIVTFYKFHGIVDYYIYSFIGGAIAPFLIKYSSFYKKINDIYSSIIVLVCLFFIGQFHTANDIYCTLLITIVFTFIALGTSLFGLLKNSTLKFLGEICYSTYLLHGILLFTVFYFGFGFENIKLLTPLEYSLVVFSITPLVVLVSFLGFKYVEKPFMDKSKLIIRKMDSNEINKPEIDFIKSIKDRFFTKMNRN